MFDQPELTREENSCEVNRINELQQCCILDTLPERRFDVIAEIAAELFEVPIALVSFVDRERQWFKARVGLEVAETPRPLSFCAHTIKSTDVLIIPDTVLDARFASNPLVTGDPHLRFYAGAPLVTPRGHNLGALCVADRKPRHGFTDRDRQLLRGLATLVVEEMQSRKNEARLNAMLGFTETTELAMISVDANGIVRFANHAARDIFRYQQDEFVGSSIDIIVPERFRAAHRAGFARVAAGGPAKLAGRTIEVVACRKDGEEFPIELSMSVWREGGEVGLGACIRDISHRRERDARLLRLANHDTLTGLCNKHHFEGALRDLFEGRRTASVLLFDLDGFKEVNDSLGHAFGDALLQAIAVRLPSALDKTAVISRMGGDEFAVLLPDNTDPLAVEGCALAVLSAIAEPFDIGHHVVQVSASIGFAIAPHHGQDAEELIASADFALYRAKRAGGRRVCMFSPHMRHESVNRHVVQDQVLQALRKRELTLHYQPQVCLRTDRIFGVEALLRWQHPTRGLLPPAAFLPSIKGSALTLPIGAWVIDEACRQMSVWRESGLPTLRVGINLFSAQFRAGTVTTQVLEALKRYGCDPSMLEVEITERIALQNDDRALHTVRELSSSGVRIAFDDFGTGYASLSWLKTYPLDTLKIDRSFVADFLSNERDAAITRAIVSMSNDLGLETIAEGIETSDQEAALRALGCKAGQGYLYGKAVPADQLSSLILTRERDGIQSEEADPVPRRLADMRVRL